jgi:hypothetical protein
MRKAICAFLEAEVAEPDAALTEVLMVRVSPAFKEELRLLARREHLSLADLLIEAFGLMERRREPLEMAVKKAFGPLAGLEKPRSRRGGRQRTDERNPSY